MDSFSEAIMIEQEDARAIELEIERNIWSKCSLCKREYSLIKEENIRMNEICSHSYCMDCIEQSASTSPLCPICDIPLPSPLSSLPINYTPHYWQILSPLPNDEIETQQICEDCAEHQADLFCNICKSILCSTCCEFIHSRKSMKEHPISPISPLSSLLMQTSGCLLPISSPIIHYYQCNRHNQKKMKLYCMTCNECICSDCIGDCHAKHSIKSVKKRVEEIKEVWKKDVKEISNDLTNRHPIKAIDEKIENFLFDIDEEIMIIAVKLKSLKEKKERMIDTMKKLKESKEKINQTRRYLLSFIQSLPSLPLSSFIPNPSNCNNININIVNINEENKKEKRRGRISDFFEKENLSSLFSSLLPSYQLPPLSTHNKITNHRKIFSKEEKEKRDELFLSNQLIQDQNLLSHFGSYGRGANQFARPNFVSYNDKLNMMGVSDYGNDRVQIMDKKGSLIHSLQSKSPSGVLIIPSLHLLAVAKFKEDVIEIFDISPLLFPPSDCRNKDPSQYQLPLLYTIGEGRGSEDHFHFKFPEGIGFSKEKGILALSDCSNRRIELYRIRRDGYEHHSFIPNLSYYPNHIAISSPGDLILSSGSDFNSKYYIKVV